MGPKTEQICVGPFLKLFSSVLRVVKDRTAIGVVDAVVDVVAKLAAANGLADDLSDGGGGGGHQEPAWLGQDFDRFGEQPVQFGVDHFRQSPEGRDSVVVVGGETAADVEQLEIEAARSGLREDSGGQMQCLVVVLRVRALAPHVEAQPLDLEFVVVSEGDQVHGLAGQGAELAGQLHHRSGVGNAQPQHQPRVRRITGDLDDLVVVIVGDQRLVGIEPLQCFNRFNRVRIDDAIPDKILPLFRRKILNQFVNGQKLGHAGDVETGARAVERLHDSRVVVRFNRVVDLDARQILSELRVVFPQRFVVHDDDRRAVFFGQLKQRLLVHGRFPWSLSAFRCRRLR